MPPDLVLDFDLQLADADMGSADTSFSVSIDDNGDGQFDAPSRSLAAFALNDLFR